MKKSMKNERFQIDIGQESGCMTAIINPPDKDSMNWCAPWESWGRIFRRKTRARDFTTGNPALYDTEEMALEHLDITEHSMRAVYADSKAESETESVAEPAIQVSAERFFTESGNLKERYRIRNVSPRVCTINRDNFAIQVPFHDSYPNADECMTGCCHTHIWCGGNVTWICALKMGVSDCNLGLVLTKGAIVSYSQNHCHLNDRGAFLLEPETVLLNAGQEYVLEWELFWHKGKSDFLQTLRSYENYIEVAAEHYTVFHGEKIEFTVQTSSESGSVPHVFLCGEEVPTRLEDDICTVTYAPARSGEHRFTIVCGSNTTYATFLVRPPFGEILKKRVDFIVNRQQCLDQDSPLYGAYLIYDNETESLYFDDGHGDHNACRERLNMPLLLARYLQIRPDSKVRASLELYMEFLKREFYEEKAGEVYNTIGKRQDMLRLYNAPGVMWLFCEMYLLTRQSWYLDQMVKLAERYYDIGGEKCYANGLAIERVMKAFRLSGRTEDECKMMAFFRRHVDHMIANGTSYPKHEVNYEQTIVTPAVTCISELGVLSGESDIYLKEAKKHLACLALFSGFQPDFRLSEIAIRYWDDFWFGKRGCYGDTLPHHLSSLTARAYISYYRLSGEESWLKAAENCLRNCMCLVDDGGRGHAAYVYPHRVNGQKGEFCDEWANDQDIFLYHALNGADLIPAFAV